MDLFSSVIRGILGLSVILAIAYAVSSDRKNINLRTIGGGLLIQFVFAVFILKGSDMAEVFSPLGWPGKFFAIISSFFVLVLRFMEEGARFVFGDLAVSPGQDGSLGFFFFAQILPTIIFFASLMAVLYYLGIMQLIVKGMAKVVSKVLGTSGPESLSATANIFVGQTEAPLVIKPYIKNLSRSELMVVMGGGMATIAGGVMASFIQILGDSYAAAAGVELDVARQMFAEQLLGASVMAAPAAIVLAKIIIPEKPKDLPDPDIRPHSDDEEVSHRDSLEIAEDPNAPRNVIEAAAVGAGDGLKLAANVGAMLIAFIALIAMINYFLGWGSGLFGYQISLEQLFGWVLAPIAWTIGIPMEDITTFGSLLGTKIVVNEFVAYLGLSDAIAAGALSYKTTVMATFALCGFANFSSIAIQLGGIGPLAPERTSEIAQLGLRAVLVGTLANLMTATIAGVLLT